VRPCQGSFKKVNVDQVNRSELRLVSDRLRDAVARAGIGVLVVAGSVVPGVTAAVMRVARRFGRGGFNLLEQVMDTLRRRGDQEGQENDRGCERATRNCKQLLHGAASI
jgi:transposase-like protein